MLHPEIASKMYVFGYPHPKSDVESIGEGLRIHRDSFHRKVLTQKLQVICQISNSEYIPNLDFLAPEYGTLRVFYQISYNSAWQV